MRGWDGAVLPPAAPTSVGQSQTELDMHRMTVGTSIRGALWLLLALRPTPAIAQGGEVARVHRLAGCWAATVGTFRSVTTIPVDSGLTNVPPLLRLDTLPGQGWHNDTHDWLLTAMPGASGSRYRDGYFKPTGKDSVELHWTNGSVGLSIRAKDAGNTLSGFASAWTDYMGEQRATIVLRRAACPSSLPK